MHTSFRLTQSWLRAGSAAALCVLWAAGASAQAPDDAATRPATTTFDGDTGLWYVPTAEVLPQGVFSVSGYRSGFNFVQGFSNVSDVAGTFGVGLARRIELFGSFKLDTRIDRDLRPLSHRILTWAARSGATRW